MNPIAVILFIVPLLFNLSTPGLFQQEMKPHYESLEKYHNQLNDLRSEFSVRELPDIRFFQFGMGNRMKFIYKDGKLYDPFTGKVYREWLIEDDIIIPNDYRVTILLKNRKHIEIYENETGVYILEDGQKSLIENTSCPINLPDFKAYRYSEVLKVLNHEILMNILDSKPLPNFMVYSKPWRRDGAMMAMCLDSTGNLNLIKDWVTGIEDPYDRNNGGEKEADNLGQTLYLVSLFSDMNHRVVQKILNELPLYEVKTGEGVFIKGRSDFHEAPVYQTKWLKYGLKSLGLSDKYIIPSVQDDYASLFWWCYKESYMPGTADAYEGWGMNKEKSPKYPYIGWAADHFHGKKRNMLSNRDYPLTWEQEASQADYTRLKTLDQWFAENKLSSPHTWHAAEMFLYLLEFKN